MSKCMFFPSKAEFKYLLLCFEACRNVFICAESNEMHNSLFRYSDKTVIAAWGLHTVGSKLNNLYSDLGENVGKCQHQIGRFFLRLIT